ADEPTVGAGRVAARSRLGLLSGWYVPAVARLHRHFRGGAAGLWVARTTARGGSRTRPRGGEDRRDEGGTTGYGVPHSRTGRRVPMVSREVRADPRSVGSRGEVLRRLHGRRSDEGSLAGAAPDSRACPEHPCQGRVVKATRPSELR